jgi:hypothetical protein
VFDHLPTSETTRDYGQVLALNVDEVTRCGTRPARNDS